MVTLNILFWIFIILFAILGAMRGWAKEILVTFSTIMALFIINLLNTYVPFFKPDSGLSPSARFWIDTVILVIMVIFGYQTPRLTFIAAEKLARNRFADGLLGFFLGALNGYLIYGSIWYFMSVAKYPFQPYIIPPDPASALGQAAIELVAKMPPVYLVPPWIYFAVAVAFIFVIVVFI